MKDKLINELIIQWLNERDEVLKTHDVSLFKEFVTRWRGYGFYDDTPFLDSSSDEVIEVAMRKMICNLPTMSQKEKKEAVEWLTSRGYTTRI